MWEININNQFMTLLLSICLGCIVCANYDILRGSRKAGFNSAMMVFFTDIFFWIINAFVTFIFLISRTNGEIRGYVLVGEFIGFLIFRISLSRFILPVFTLIFSLFKKLMICINNGFEFLYVKTDTILHKIYRLLCKFIESLSKSVKKLLKNRHKVLYTNKNNYDAEYVLNETKT